ncbi:MAG: hypothetical protein ABDH34_08350 [Dictyoglomus thermophilum]
MKMKAKDIIKVLELEKEYEEFKETMNEMLIKFQALGISEDIVMKNLVEKFKEEKSFLALIFLDAYEEECNK